MAFRTVTGQFFKAGTTPWADAEVWFTLQKGSYSVDAHYPADSIKVLTDVDGRISVDLWISEEAQSATNWLCRQPSGETFKFGVPAGVGPISLEDLRALGSPSQPETPSLSALIDNRIAQHNANPSAHPGLSGGGAGVPLPTLPAATALSALRIVSGDGTNYAYSDPTDPDSVWSIAGLTTSAISQGQPCTPVRNQPITDSAWNWNTSKPIVLGPNGTLMQSDSADWGVQVATPLSPQTIFIQIERPIEL